MAKLRMFDGSQPEQPASPRTTIVGGRPPESGAKLPPIPTGLQELLRMASVDPEFKRELIARREAMGGASKVALTPSEAAILKAVSGAQLLAMIEGLPPVANDRRTFLRQTAAAAVVALGGAVLDTGCRDMRTEGGIRPDVPNRPQDSMITRGINPDIPRPELPEPTKGIRPDVPEEERPEAMPVTRGIRPDIPLEPEPGPDAGTPDAAPRPDQMDMPIGGIVTDRPERPHPTRGIRVDLPPLKK